MYKYNSHFSHKYKYLKCFICILLLTMEGAQAEALGEDEIIGHSLEADNDNDSLRASKWSCEQTRELVNLYTDTEW